MNSKTQPVLVAINGYGVIGKRVADAVSAQKDMTVVGISDVAADWRLRSAKAKNYPVFGAAEEHLLSMRAAGLAPLGVLSDLLEIADLVVDCTPKHVAAKNIPRYRSRGIKFIVQGGESHSVTGHSFNSEQNYPSALGRDSTRVVSCNTTSIVRTLSTLKRAGLLKRARGTLLRRATDPWESHRGGIMNTLLPERDIPSHQGPDAQTVDPELDVLTMAVKVPETIAHLHYWAVQLTRPSNREEVLQALKTSSRIAFPKFDEGLEGINSVKELMADLGRPHDNLYEVAIWEEMLTVREDEAFYAYMVDNQAIVIPETIDAIRALTELEEDPLASIARTNTSLGIGEGFDPA